MSAGNYPDSFMNEVKDEGGVVKAGIEAFGADNTYFFNYDLTVSSMPTSLINL